MSLLIKSLTFQLLHTNRKSFHNIFRYRPTLTTVCFSQTLNKMPPKKVTNTSTKRKTAEPIVPKVKDPFSASKRPKKEDNDVVEIENEKFPDKADMNPEEKSKHLSLNGSKNKDGKKNETSRQSETLADVLDDDINLYINISVVK